MARDFTHVPLLFYRSAQMSATGLTHEGVRRLTGWSHRNVLYHFKKHRRQLVFGPTYARGGGRCGRAVLIPVTALPEWARAAFLAFACFAKTGGGHA